ncbi:MAG TPA: TetR/AcrR family transcriptional regulator [Pseudonocardiaceae bacterium]|jgi:AcrR family transcriptional regulator|nr:TetR/AcrR family transcriptional regulator [Pseudonocardiaceae bacterium]
MTTEIKTGRINQKLRTRTAIVAAARQLIGTGGDVTMPAVARAALVSEATAYRYFPDLVSLLVEAMTDLLPDPVTAFRSAAQPGDPVERVAFATELLLRQVLTYRGAVRAMISATITRPELVDTRPGIRFGLIEHALEPLRDNVTADTLAQLTRDLAVVMSAEALFNLIDLCGCAPDDALASVVRTASTLTRAALATGGKPLH